MRNRGFIQGRNVEIAKAVSGIKNLVRKILKGKPPAFAIFIVHPRDKDEEGQMAVARYVNLEDEDQARTLLSAIDDFLEPHRPKDVDGR